MNSYCKIYLLSLFLLVVLITPAFSGGNPFSGDKVTLQDSASAASDTKLKAVSEGSSEVATVDVSGSLNVRTSPWGDVTGSLKNGDKVTITGQIGDWYKISANGKTAYVHSAYIKRKGEGAKPFPSSGRVNATLLNVRRVPHGDILGQLKNQASVEILGSTGDYYKIKWGENEAFVSKKYIDTDASSSTPPASKPAQPSFVGYVTASALNVRTSPWGNIAATIPNGIAVKVTGKEGDWYRIDYNGSVRYVHSSYISKTKPAASSGTTSTPATSAGSGTLQQKIARSARALIGSTAFRTADVDYGNLACAKVVSTALKNAGAISSVHLNVRSTVADLRSKGWKEVSVPPFAEGDVITWKTYDYTGDGVKDPDTHIGIMIKEGNTYKAMNNSSSLRTPRLSDPYAIGPVTRVMRKV